MPARDPVKHRFLISVLVVACLGATSWIEARNEGMWTFDNLPLAELRDEYDFVPTDEWTEHLRLSSVRLNDGGSGAFVSPRGLVLTNHHVALRQIQNLSTPEADYASQGFYATTLADELPAPDLEINVLVSMEDVTARVQAAVTSGANDAQALTERRTAIAAIEKESLDDTGFRSNVVALYRGGEYWLYRYKRYTDVRLVFSPESQAAFFGGDSDNFTYPRYSLDVAFLRVYEDGQPADTTNYFQMNPAGAAPDDLVFVVGNPGTTDRLKTTAQLAFERDVRLPVFLDYFETYEVLLRAYAARGPEQARQAGFLMLAVTNAQKAFRGELRGLEDENIWRALMDREQAFRERVSSTAMGPRAAQAWDAIARATEEDVRTFRQRTYSDVVDLAGPGGMLAGMASTLVRYVTEVEKPDGERLPGYHESDREALEFRLLSPAPVYPDFEEYLMAGFLEKARDELGADDARLSTVLAGRSPAATAAALIGQTSLADPDVRRSLLEGGQAAVAASTDPLIVLMRTTDAERRADEAWYRDTVESVLEAEGNVLADARFAAYGRSTYPDATFTPRLAFGAVRGYPMNGTRAPHQTTLFGLFDRAVSFGREGEYALPDRYWQRRDRLDLSTPVNFVSTADVTGGNSGSPVVNRDGELVGVIFDGNIESLVGAYTYDDTVSRAVAVHAAYVIEALTELYDAAALADELLGR